MRKIEHLSMEARIPFRKISSFSIYEKLWNCVAFCFVVGFKAAVKLHVAYKDGDDAEGDQ